MRIATILLGGALLLASCSSQRRATYNYLEEIKDTSFRKSVYMTEPVIQKGDMMSVQVYSASTDPKVDQLYNMPVAQGTQYAAGQQGQGIGYLVDQNGNLELPRIGVLHVEGLTKSQLINEIKSKLEGQLTNPSVIVRFLNYRITVLGEVRNPGVMNVTSERLNILEAVGMAGGITEYGKIKEVKVLREINGERELGVLDLTSKDIFTSPYYQLKQNDVILVDQTRYKLRQTEQTRVSQQLGFALSIITSIALLYNIFKK